MPIALEPIRRVREVAGRTPRRYGSTRGDSTRSTAARALGSLASRRRVNASLSEAESSSRPDTRTDLATKRRDPRSPCAISPRGPTSSRASCSGSRTTIGAQPTRSRRARPCRREASATTRRPTTPARSSTATHGRNRRMPSAPAPRDRAALAAASSAARHGPDRRTCAAPRLRARPPTASSASARPPSARSSCAFVIFERPADVAIRASS